MDEVTNDGGSSLDLDRPDPQDQLVRPTSAEWENFAERHDRQIVDVLRPMLDGDGLIKLTATELASRASVDDARAAGALADLAARQVVSTERTRFCGCCDDVVDEEQAAAELCVHCGGALHDCGVVEKLYYIRAAVRGRDSSWILVLHGMKTVGAWQEELNWLIVNSYQRSVPVFVYKYGKILHGAFVRRRQRQLIRDLTLKLRKLTETYGGQTAGKPDVIAHSFGTWLIGHVLLENRDLAVGRIVLAGSILRPDFEWGELFARGQVEAVLNHIGMQDKWVPLAQLVIPDAGPSGAVGFEDGRVIHRVDRALDHSSFFAEERIVGNYENVWNLFFRRPAARLSELAVGAGSGWRPLPTIVHEALRLALLCLVTAPLALGVVCVGIGATSLMRWLT